MKKFLLLIVAIMLVLPLGVNANNDVETSNPVNIYLFYDQICLNCKALIEFLEYHQTNEFEVHFFEISRSAENENLMRKVQGLMDNQSPYIPFTIIGSHALIGFNPDIEARILSLIESYLKYGDPDIVGGIIDGSITEENVKEIMEEDPVELDGNFVLPILGDIDPLSASLPIIALVIGFVDGFNPCSLWVLLFLLAMVFNMENKKKGWALAVAFLLTTVIFYGIMMVALLHVAVSMAGIVWIRTAIGVFAIGAGLYSLRKYHKMITTDTGCQVVNDKRRKKLMNRIIKITSGKSFILALIGVMTLAVSVNFVQLVCTVGLPLIFTQILAINELSFFASTMYILLYLFAFISIELFIFTTAVITMQVTGISNKFTKYSHLFGGIIMILLGLLLIFRPEWAMLNF